MARGYSKDGLVNLGCLDLQTVQISQILRDAVVLMVQFVVQKGAEVRAIAKLLVVLASHVDQLHLVVLVQGVHYS